MWFSRRELLGEVFPDASEVSALEALVRGRLLVAREGEGDTAYEIAHEALVSGWQTLKEWLGSEAERRAVRERLRAAAAEWGRFFDNDESLWGERQLRELNTVGLGEEKTSEIEAQFLRASWRRVRKKRWGRRLAGAGGLLLLLALVLVSRRTLDQGRRSDLEMAQRERTQLIELGSFASALAELPDRESPALVAAIQATAQRIRMGAVPEPQALEGLSAAVQAARRSRPLRGHRGAVGSACFSPQSEGLGSDHDNLVLTAGWDGTLRLWDARTGALLKMVAAHAPAPCVAQFSPDGQLVATLSGDKTVALWEAASLRFLHRFPLEEQPAGYSFSPDGKRLLVLTESAAQPTASSVSLWDTASGQHLASWPGQSSMAPPGPFSPDGSRVVVGQSDGVVNLYDTTSAELLFTLLVPKEHAVAGPLRVGYSPDGQQILGTSAERERFVAPLPRRELLRALAGGEAPATLDSSLHRLTPASLMPEPRLVRAAVPLSVAGLSERALDGLREALAGYQVRPLQAGGAGVAGARGPERFEPGGALGVQLIRGDISATGVGTVTHVDGEKVMGFGHPMLGDGGAGEVLFPIATAEVVTILSSLSSSFKMATPLGTLGSLLLDRETGVVGEVHRQAPMVPVQVTVQIPGQSDRVFSTEIASHRFLTPLLAASVASSSIQSAAPDVSDVTVRVQSRLGLRGFAPLMQTDTLYSPGGVTPRLLQSSSGMRHLPELLFNPFGPTRVERLDLAVAVEYKSEVAEIIGLSLVSDELEPDTRPSLYVTLRPYNGIPQVRAVPLDIPRSLAGQTLKIEASAGNLVKPEIAPPESLTDLVENLRKGYAARQLVVTLTTTEEGVSHRGRLIPSLPASVIATLRPGSTTRRGEVYKRLTRFAVDADTVLVGTKELTVQVKDDSR